jgi:hypothetical protein
VPPDFAGGPFFIFLWRLFMYSNERKAVLSALDALGRALIGVEYDEEVAVEGGKEYDGTRELCEKIIAVADAAWALAARVKALEEA